MMPIKILFSLVITHFALTFYVSTRQLLPHQYRQQIFYIDSFFKQSWSFFGPKPIINNIDGEFKCINLEKVSNWENLSNALKENALPLSSIFISNNEEYIVETLVERIIYQTPEQLFNLCSKGNCSLAESYFNSESNYLKMKKIVKDNCKKDPRNIAGKIRITVRNINYYSDTLVKKGTQINDIFEFSAFEI